MKKYLAVFIAPIASYDKMKEDMKKRSPDELKAGMDEWNKWMERHKANIADQGAPVGKAKRITEDGSVSDIRNEIGGYMIIQANSADEAAAIFKDSPHFGVMDSAVEVMEITPM
jgi:hypothetical protein